jgi:hypothetical protein
MLNMKFGTLKLAFENRVQGPGQGSYLKPWDWVKFLGQSLYFYISQTRSLKKVRAT